MATRTADWPAWAGSAARTTGCGLAPPSRVEEFKEVIVLCGMASGMQDVCLILGWGCVTCWRRQALKIMWPCYACVALRWHMDVCVRPPPRFPPTAWRRRRQECNLPRQLSSRWMHMFGRDNRVDKRHVTRKIDGKRALFNLPGRQLSAKTVVNLVSHPHLADAEAW